MQAELVSKAYEVADADEFTELAYERGWTDGIPVLPPTEKKVTAMLDYLKRDAQEVIGIVPPGEGVASLEKIAINCAMAGCKPEYLPVVITALQAMLDDRFELNRVQATTGGPAPLAIISGPVVKKLGFNYGEGGFSGTGHRANSTIGRAIRLILWNIGFGRPGELSHATFGHPARYCYLIAERPGDDGNPWEPLHLSAAGLSPEDSAVSMFPVKSHGSIETGIGLQTVENNFRIIASEILSLGSAYNSYPRLFVINPQGANVLAKAGWTKERVRDELLERCKRPVRDLKRTAGGGTTNRYHWTKLAPSLEDDDAMVPAMAGTDFLHILVSGGWAPPSSQCCVLTGLHGSLVTRRIEWSWE